MKDKLQKSIIISPPEIEAFVKNVGQIDDLVKLENLPFQATEKAETDEGVRLFLFRVKKSGEREINNAILMNFFENVEMIQFLKEKTGLDDFEIDRCQSHIYRKGDFLDKHNDAETYPDYLFTVLFFVSDAYEGGEFVVYEDNKEISFKPQKHSILITPSAHSHKVNPVLSGERKVIIAFLKARSI